MAVYDIAGLKVYMNPKGKTLLTQGKKYLSEVQIDENKCDIVINLNRLEVEQWIVKYSHPDYDSCEYHWFGYQFFKKIPDYGGAFFHASAVCLDGCVYVFSAPKGTGKSTHTYLWQQYFGAENAVIINDDKPVIRITHNGAVAFGNPFSGKNDISANMSGSVAGICFLQQSPNNSIRKISTAQALPLLLSQTLVLSEPLFMEALLSICDKIMQTIPVYILQCNISPQAVVTAYNTMKPKKQL